MEEMNGFEIFDDEGVIETQKETKTAKDVMKEKIKSFDPREEIKKASLFDDDEDYLAQCKEADKAELVDSARNFLGVKIVKSCYNCGWNRNGACHVMTKFNQHLLLPTGDLEKCKHWKKEEQ